MYYIDSLFIMFTNFCLDWASFWSPIWFIRSFFKSLVIFLMNEFCLYFKLKLASLPSKASWIVSSYALTRFVANLLDFDSTLGLTALFLFERKDSSVSYFLNLIVPVSLLKLSRERLLLLLWDNAISWWSLFLLMTLRMFLSISLTTWFLSLVGLHFMSSLNCYKLLFAFFRTFISFRFRCTFFMLCWLSNTMVSSFSLAREESWDRWWWRLILFWLTMFATSFTVRPSTFSLLSFLGLGRMVESGMVSARPTCSERIESW